MPPKKVPFRKTGRTGKEVMEEKNDDYVFCEKCDNKIKYNDLPPGEWWIECRHQGWYCPNCSPTMNCGDEECECCFG